MAVGAAVARGEWLLFTDADTVHKPGSLARAVTEARQQRVALLSYSPEQEVRGFWEKAVMPVIFAELAATFPPARVSDPRSPAAAANGQYILIAREAYDAVGGHAAVSGSLLEDVALAKAVKASGRKIFFRFGGDAVRTRMYRNFSQLREGWTKNLALLFPSPAAPCAASTDRVCADRRRRRRGPCGFAARPRAGRPWRPRFWQAACTASFCIEFGGRILPGMRTPSRWPASHCLCIFCCGPDSLISREA